MFKKIGGIVAAISFFFFVTASFLGAINRANGVVSPFMSVFAILGLWGMVCGSFLYFAGKFQEKKLAEENTCELSTDSNVFCSKCGGKTKANGKFCVICGTAMEE